MAWTNDNANTSTLTNDPQSGSNTLTWNDLNVPWDDEEGTWDNPRAPWIRDSANTSVLTNDSANP